MSWFACKHETCTLVYSRAAEESVVLVLPSTKFQEEGHSQVKDNVFAVFGPAGVAPTQKVMTVQTIFRG